MIVYIDNTKKCIMNKNQTKELLALISEFSVVTVYKINIENSVAFLYMILTVNM